MKFTRTGVALILISLCAAAGWSAPQTVPLTNWKFIKADPTVDESVADWQRVTVPHTWNAEDGRGDTYYRGPAWYQMMLNPDQFAGADRVFVRFQAVGTVADVIVDGEKVAHHVGGYTAFSAELTPFLKDGQAHDLRVRASNEFTDTVAPLSGDFTVWGGMHRPAELLLKNEVCLSSLDHASSGVYLFQENVSEENANLRVQTLIDNGADAEKKIRLVVSLKDAKGETVAENEIPVAVDAGVIAAFEQVLSLEKPHLWHGIADPYLYTLTVELFDGEKLVDQYLKKTGFRFFHTDPESGFYLNGKPYPLRGVNLHYDRKGVGPLLTKEHVMEDYERVMEIGANTVRMAHYPHAEIAYEHCDELGLLVWAEIPVVNSVKMRPGFTAGAGGQLRDMIKQLGNHSAIYCWGIANEILHRHGDSPYELLEQLHMIAKYLDPTRYTTMASNKRREDRLNRITDILAFNHYPGWYGENPESMSARIDRYNQSGGLRGVGVSEYGAGGATEHQSQKLEHVDTRGSWHPEQWQAYLHERQYSGILQHPECWGSYVWIMFDFTSAGRTEGAHDGLNDKGLMTHDHKTRKDAFFFYKANWADEPVLHLTSKRHLVRRESTTPVKVYSNCDEVDLIVNGRPIGTVETDHLNIALWKSVTLAEGPNEIMVKALADGRELTDRITWTFHPLPHDAP
jgi:beta-galactosidase